MSRLRRLLRPRKDEDFAREVEAHLAMEIEDQIARGVSPEEARAAALRAFGNPTRAREDFRERSPWFRVDTLWQDVQYGGRALRRAPIVVLVAIASLALGIGANTAIFTLVKATILAPLHVPEPDRVFTAARASGAVPARGFLYSEFLHFREVAADVGSLAAYSRRLVRLRIAGAEDEAALGAVSHEYLDVASVPLVAGRWFTADEARARDHVALISESFWREAFSADPAVAGRIVHLNGLPFVVVGIAPDRFWLSAGRTPPVLVPLTVMPALMQETFPANWLEEDPPHVTSPSRWLDLAVRLAPGITPDAAEARLKAADATAAAASGAPGVRGDLMLVPARDAALPFGSRADVVRFLLLLAGTVGLVLLIGCANLALVALARAEERRREMAIRLALGGSRWRLTRQLLIESSMLAAAGGAAGLVVSTVMLRTLAHFSLPGRLAIETLPLTPDIAVLAFTVLVSVAAALMFGLTPALRTRHVPPVDVLRQGGTGASAGRGRIRSLLLAAEVALATLLLVGAGLFVRSVQAGLHVDLGYDAGDLVFVSLRMPASAGPVQLQTLGEQMLSRVRQTPGVAAAAVGPAPFSTTLRSSRIVVDGEVHTLEGVRVQFVGSGPGYRQALGLPLLEGRDLEARDMPPAGADAAPPRVALVNEAFVMRFLQGRPAIGRRFEAAAPDPVEIVGIVGQGRFDDLRDSDVPAAYLPIDWARAFGRIQLAVRTSRDRAGVMDAVVRDVRAAAPGAPPPQVTTADGYIETVLEPERLGARLLGWFSTLALLLALAGTYGLAAWAVSRRTTEIGVRVALGATPGRVVREILSGAMLPLAAGVAIGCAGAWHLSVLARQFLFDVEPHDAVSFTLAAAGLLVCGTIAAWLPARRAARIDPSQALREL